MIEALLIFGGAVGAAVLHRAMASSSHPVVQKVRVVIFGGGGPGEPRSQ